jgi:hypothetical protein
MTEKWDEQYDEAEAARRRDEVIKRMLATPPQPRVKKAFTDSNESGEKGAALVPESDPQ